MEHVCWGWGAGVIQRQRERRKPRERLALGCKSAGIGSTLLACRLALRRNTGTL